MATDNVAAALAWFWDRPAPGLSADDITHGIVLAREVRRLAALVEAAVRFGIEDARCQILGGYGLVPCDLDADEAVARWQKGGAK